MVDLMFKNIPEELAKRILEAGKGELAFRKGNQRFEMMKKYAVQLVKNNKSQFNPEVFSKLNVALAAVNVAATVISTIIICNKLNRMGDQLNEIRKGLEDIKDLQLRTTVLQADTKLTEEYKLNSRRIEKGEKIPKDEMLDFIRECNRNIGTLYTSRNEANLDTILGEIFILLPMMYSYIMLYYQTYYTPEEGANVLHEDWVRTLDNLASDEFMNEIQDYMFLEKGLSNRDVNEYLFTQRRIVAEYRNRITQLLSDLNDFGSTEGYQDAMQWSRQYAAQQAKALQTELEAEYGEEKAKEVMAQVMEMAGA